MQYSKKTSELMRLYNLDAKDVFFAFLVSAGASNAEAFAVIFRPATTTNNTLASKASQLIGQKPGLQRLIDELCKDPDNPEAPAPRRGRPRKDKAKEMEEDTPILDYTDKDAVLKELARIAERSKKESDKLAAIREISALQRMKQEAAVEDEKRVIYYIPHSYDKCDELLYYLRRYYKEKDSKSAV